MFKHGDALPLACPGKGRKGALCRGDRGLGIFDVAETHRADLFLRRRILEIGDLRAMRGYELAVDIDLVDDTHRLLLENDGLNLAVRH
ncbi:hypothetical protein D3C87_1733540 [compost metagenome]